MTLTPTATPSLAAPSGAGTALPGRPPAPAELSVDVRPGAGPAPLDESEEALWRSFRRIALTLPRALEDDLGRNSGMTMTEYVVLMHLSEAPQHQLRMTELARRSALSASRITRLVDELAGRGLAVKVRFPGDGRGNVTALTPAGLAKLEHAYPAHLASVRRHLIDRLDPGAVTALAAALQSVAESLDRDVSDS